jgi:hypothetical protein
MRKLFFVDAQMCGGDSLPSDFDLEDFCEVLQGRLTGVEIVPVLDPKQRAANFDHTLVNDTVFREALTSYLRR